MFSKGIGSFLIRTCSCGSSSQAPCAGSLRIACCCREGTTRASFGIIGSASGFGLGSKRTAGTLPIAAVGLGFERAAAPLTI